MTYRAKTYDEIAVLIDLCKKGRLFEVQDWIARGNPVNPPVAHSGKGRRQNPLEIAIERGFHSLAQVLIRKWCINGGVAVFSPCSCTGEKAFRYGATPGR